MSRPNENKANDHPDNKYQPHIQVDDAGKTWYHPRIAGKQVGDRRFPTHGEAVGYSKGYDLVPSV